MKILKQSILLSIIILGNLNIALGQWSQINSPSNIPFCNVEFPTGQIGYGSANSNLYKTTNGGSSWSIIDSSENICLLYFLNADTGLVFYKNLIKTTTNGGQSWNNVSPPYSNVLYYRSVFFKNCLGWIAFSVQDSITNIITDYIVRTYDCGNSWSSKVQYNFSGDLFFTDSNHGFSINNTFDSLSKTNDGGKTWNNFSMNYTATGSNYYFIDSLIGFAGGFYNGLLLNTTDGGISWVELNIVNGTAMPEIIDIETKDSVIYAISSGGIFVYKSNDLGQTWVSQSTDLSKPWKITLNADIDIVNSDTIYISDGKGNIIRTTNGGGTVGIQENNSLKKR